MRLVRLLLLMVPILVFPALTNRPHPMIELTESRIQQCLQLWCACDSFTTVYTGGLESDPGVGTRNNRYALSLYWSAELWAYRSLNSMERYAFWEQLLPGDAHGQRDGEAFLSAILTSFIPATPTVPRRGAAEIQEIVRKDLLLRGINPGIVHSVVPTGTYRPLILTPPNPRWRLPS